MIKRAINLAFETIEEFEDDEMAAVHVSNQLDLEECPGWLFDLVEEVREEADENPDRFAGESQRDSWIEELCEKYSDVEEEEAA